MIRTVERRKVKLHVRDGVTLEIKQFTRIIIDFLIRQNRINDNRYTIMMGDEFASRTYVRHNVDEHIIFYPKYIGKTLGDTLNGTFRHVKNIYDFDITTYAKENNISVSVAQLIFIILHEVGHCRTNEKLYNKHGRDFHTLIHAQYKEVYEKDDNWFKYFDDYKTAFEILSKEYRLIPNESKQDKFAISTMVRYKKDFEILFHE